MMHRKFSLKNFKNFHTVAHGNSMRPLLWDGDIVFIKKIDINKLKTEDIILIEKNHNRYIHRIIYKSISENTNKTYFLTKGDNSAKSDGRCFARDIIGKVEKIKRKSKIIHIDQLYLMQSSIYFAEILKIKEEFEKNKIEILFLKGLPIHLYYEGTHPRRIYADCDVLIYLRDLVKANSIFDKLGYKSNKDQIPFYEKLFVRNPTQYSYQKKINGCMVIFDLHFGSIFMFSRLGKTMSLDPRFLLEKLTLKFLKEKKRITINHQNFNVLSLENMMIYQALNIFHHNFFGTFRMSLLAAIVKKGEIDFQRITYICKEYKISNYVYPSIQIASKFYGVSIPTKFINQIKPKNDYKKRYADKLIADYNINDEISEKLGYDRTKNLFYLSDIPLYRKLLIFTESPILYSLIRKLILNHLKRLFRYYYFFRKQVRDYCISIF